MNTEVRTIQTRRARATGTEVSVVYMPGEDASCRWQTECEHGSCIGHQTRALAVSFAPAPDEWCEECAEAKQCRERPTTPTRG